MTGSADQGGLTQWCSEPVQVDGDQSTALLLGPKALTPFLNYLVRTQLTEFGRPRWQVVVPLGPGEADAVALGHDVDRQVIQAAASFAEPYSLSGLRIILKVDDRRSHSTRKTRLPPFHLEALVYHTSSTTRQLNLLSLSSITSVSLSGGYDPPDLLYREAHETTVRLHSATQGDDAKVADLHVRSSMAVETTLLHEPSRVSLGTQGDVPRPRLPVPSTGGGRSVFEVAAIVSRRSRPTVRLLAPNGTTIESITLRADAARALEGVSRRMKPLVLDGTSHDFPAVLTLQRNQQLSVPDVSAGALSLAGGSLLIEGDGERLRSETLSIGLLRSGPLTIGRATQVEPAVLVLGSDRVHPHLHLLGIQLQAAGSRLLGVFGYALVADLKNSTVSVASGRAFILGAADPSVSLTDPYLGAVLHDVTVPLSVDGVSTIEQLKKCQYVSPSLKPGPERDLRLVTSGRLQQRKDRLRRLLTTTSWPSRILLPRRRVQSTELGLSNAPGVQAPHGGREPREAKRPDPDVAKAYVTELTALAASKGASAASVAKLTWWRYRLTQEYANGTEKALLRAYSVFGYGEKLSHALRTWVILVLILAPLWMGGYMHLLPDQHCRGGLKPINYVVAVTRAVLAPAAVLRLANKPEGLAVPCHLASGWVTSATVLLTVAVTAVILTLRKMVRQT